MIETTKHPSWQAKMRAIQEANKQAELDKAYEDALKENDEYARKAKVFSNHLQSWGIIDTSIDLAMPRIILEGGYTIGYDETDFSTDSWSNGKEVAHSFHLIINKEVPNSDKELAKKFRDSGYATHVVRRDFWKKRSTYGVISILNMVTALEEHAREQEKINAEIVANPPSTDQSDPQPVTPEPEFKATVEEILLLKALREWKGA